MNDEARRVVVAALVGLAGSHDYRDRADAGRGLAGFAEAAEARGSLLELVLDAGDTFVTVRPRLTNVFAPNSSTVSLLSP